MRASTSARFATNAKPILRVGRGNHTLQGAYDHHSSKRFSAACVHKRRYRCRGYPAPCIRHAAPDVTCSMARTVGKRRQRNGYPKCYSAKSARSPGSAPAPSPLRSCRRCFIRLTGYSDRRDLQVTRKTLSLLRYGYLLGSLDSVRRNFLCKELYLFPKCH
jgi:hypothetical protein